MPSSHLILCRPLLLQPPVPSSIRVFSNESTLCIRWPKYWSFNFNISPSNEHPGLISFRMDWLDLLAVQGTLKSLFQHYSWKASILQRSAFFIVQLSHPYMTPGKTIALTGQTFVGKGNRYSPRKALYTFIFLLKLPCTSVFLLLTIRSFIFHWKNVSPWNPHLHPIDFPDHPWLYLESALPG